MPTAGSHPVYIANVSSGQGRPPAELINAACRTVAGIAIMDRYFDALMGDGSIARVAARKLCASCLVRDECDAWITRAENPAGAWHGMYAGLTPSERRHRAEARASVREASAS